MKHNPIMSAIMALQTSENFQCFFECERMNFPIFWHPQEQSPGLTYGYIIKLTSSYRCSINHAVSWNLGLFSLRYFGHFSKTTSKFSVIFYFGTFLYDWKWHLRPNSLTFFSVISKQLRSVTDKSPKKHIETQPRKCFWFFEHPH